MYSFNLLDVRVGLAFIDTDIVPIAIAIGMATMCMVTLGVMLGRRLGAMVGRRAEIIGGIILIGIGSLILFEHLSVLA